jgi:hypothetical protein
MEFGGCAVGNGTCKGRYDLHCSLLDLPRAFETTLDTIPPPLTLAVPDGTRRVWEERLSRSRRPKIGLVWAGNPKNSSDGTRSMRLDLLEPVLEAYPNAEFFSFQVGRASEEVRRYAGRITDLQQYQRTLSQRLRLCRKWTW